MATNADIEMLWVNAWSDLYEVIKDRDNVRCLLPDGEIVDVEECKHWLQDSAYSGFIPTVTAGWVLGRPGVVASRELAPAAQPDEPRSEARLPTS